MIVSNHYISSTDAPKFTVIYDSSDTEEKLHNHYISNTEALKLMVIYDSREMEGKLPKRPKTDSLLQSHSP